jgi:ABC-type multidrug transport system fused ATPase/permease subunit
MHHRRLIYSLIRHAITSGLRKDDATGAEIKEAARMADLDKDIAAMAEQLLAR